MPDPVQKLTLPSDWGTPDVPTETEAQPSTLARLAAMGLRVGGPIVGGIIGSIADPILGPLGTMGGGALGGGLGEYAAEKLEGRKSVNPYHVGVNAVLGGIPGSATVTEGRALGSALKGTALAEAGNIATRKSEGGNFLPSKEELPMEAASAAGGGIIGGLIGKYGGGKSGVVNKVVNGTEPQVGPTRLPNTQEILKDIRTSDRALAPAEQKILNDEILKGNTKPIKDAFKARKELGETKQSISGVDPKELAQTAKNENARLKYIQATQSQDAKNLAASAKYKRGLEVAQAGAEKEDAARTAKITADAEKEARRQAAQDIIDAAKAGKVPYTGNPKETYTADNGVGKESVTVTHANPPEDLPGGEGGGGESTGPVEGPQLPKLGQVFSDKQAADDAAAVIGGKTRVTTKGTQVVPKEYGTRAPAARPAGPGFDDTTGLGLPTGTQPPGGGPPQSSGRPPWRALPPRTSQAKPTVVPEAANDEEAIFNALAADAMKQGYQGSAEDLRTAFNDKMKDAHELHQTMLGTDLETDPKNLLRKIVARGGIKIDPEGNEATDFARLWDDKSKGTIRGVKGVLKQGGEGLTPDRMLHSLAGEAEAENIKYPADLAKAIEHASTVAHEPATLAKAAEGAGLKKGTKWWEPPTEDATNFEPSPVEKLQAEVKALHDEVGSPLKDNPDWEPWINQDPNGLRESDLQAMKDHLLTYKQGVAPEADLLPGTTNTNEEVEAARDRAAERRIAEFDRRMNAGGGRRSTDTQVEPGNFYGDRVTDQKVPGAEPEAAAKAPEDVVIPGLEDVRSTENPTPPVADTPFTLEGGTAPTTQSEGDLLAGTEEPQRPLPKGVIPARDILKTPLKVAGEHYQALQSEGKTLSGIKRSEQPAKLAGRAAQRLRKEEGGAINPLLMQRLGFGATGALVGGTQGDTTNERIRNAVLGGAFGGLAPSMWGGSEDLFEGFKKGAPKVETSAGRAMDALNTVHNIGLFGPTSVLKKGLADIGGLGLAAAENPRQAGGIMRAMVHGMPQAIEAGRTAFNTPLMENAAGIQNVLHSTPLLSWAGRSMAGLTGITKNLLEQANFSPELQSYYTGTAKPQTKFLKDALRLQRENKFLQNIAPTARMMINRIEAGTEHSPFGLIRANNLYKTGDIEGGNAAVIKALIGTGATTAAYAATPEDFVKKHPTEASVIAAATSAPLSIPVAVGMGLKTLSKTPWSDTIKNLTHEVPGLELIESAGRSLPSAARNYLSSYTNSLRNAADVYDYATDQQPNPDIYGKNSEFYSKALSNIPGVREMLPQKPFSASGLKMDQTLTPLKMPTF